MRTLPPLYAHRLGRDAGPDSSPAALAVTLTAGADGLETDVCLTAGAELALLQDPLLEPRQARLCDRHGRPTDQRAMRLDGLLDAAPPGLPLQLDVKTHGDPELAVATVDASSTSCCTPSSSACCARASALRPPR